MIKAFIKYPGTCKKAEGEGTVDMLNNVFRRNTYEKIIKIFKRL